MGYNPSYKWINPTYPIYNWGYNPLTKWDEPPSRLWSSHYRDSESAYENGGMTISKKITHERSIKPTWLSRKITILNGKIHYFYGHVQ